MLERLTQRSVRVFADGATARSKFLSATDAETVLDARFDYRFDTGNGSLNLFFNINDLLDTEPEDFFTAVYSSNVAAGTGLNVTGENRGRRYTLGLRMAF